MRTRFWRPLISSLIFTGAIFVAGCSGSDKSGTGSKLSDNGAFDPAPAQSARASVESQLKLYKGQTQFLNVSYYGRFYANGLRAAVPASAEAAPGGGKREVQESDVFKVGKPGSKLLYLLNNYRGLQVVSFTDGADKPKIEGRVEPTGNSPDTMYYDQENDRLVVVERSWIDSHGESNWQSQVSHVLVYDVKDPSSPKITQSVEFNGDVADSRMVGNVLYVAASYNQTNNYSYPVPFYRVPSSDQQKPLGFVYSFKVSKDGLEKVAEFKLDLPTYRENMNIVEVLSGNTYKYYLVATLTNSAWGWWNDRASAVEVVDISDAAGAIKSVMVAPVKGLLIGRSATQIKNDTLIAVSNYRGEQGQRLARIAIETYKFPTGKDEVLSADEVNYRKLYIQRELKSLTGDARDAKEQELLNAKDLGLRGRFENNATSKLEKIVADSTVTLGDTQGQNAQLQDVRYTDNLLYVFWVPANQIDPLEVLDISKPEEGVKYLSKLPFDGWTPRSFPLQYNNKNYILGLGWIVPDVNNEQSKRYPQARLIEVVKAGSKVRENDIADIKLSSENAWSNLNGQDKLVELNYTNPEKGQGSVLFELSQWTQADGYRSGGKIIGFDLSKADTGDVFTEGSLLSSDSGWLKRVFTNKEISKVNTFTDEELGVFDVEGTGAAASVEKAIARLELARNIVKYFTLTPASGVQVLSHENYSWNYDGGDTSKTELRFVDAKAADSEKDKLLSSAVQVNGRLEDAAKLSDNSLLVVSSIYSRTKTGDNQYETKTTYNVTLVSADAHKAPVTVSFEPLKQQQTARYSWWSNQQGGTIVPIDNNSVYLNLDSQAYLASLNPLAVKPVEMKNCDLNGTRSSSLTFFDNTPYLSWQYAVDSSGKRIDPQAQAQAQRSMLSETYVANYVSALNSSNDKATLTCTAAVNVPGSLLSARSGHLVTNDQRFIDRIKIKNGDNTYTQPITKPVMVSLKLANNTAEVVDLYDPSTEVGAYGDPTNSFKKLSGDRFVFIESSSEQRQVYGPYYRPAQSNSGVLLSTMSFDGDYNFLRSSKYLQLGLQSPNLLQVIEANGTYYGLLTSGQKLQVVKWTDQNSAPALVKVQKVGVDFTLQPAAEFTILQNPYAFWWGGPSNVEFVPSTKMITFAMGMNGVAQVKLAD